ncbi:hypothetical protein HZH66_002606 [Vespula vulgaris]|uniref:Uncharacterized protein n=1 Tax=Vespula vulgaris TaxID=7454 RepID=A0A834KHG8_VESVU|nr:hypothetical protein HZH66_002606 [Vespula vulgaris]
MAKYISSGMDGLPGTRVEVTRHGRVPCGLSRNGPALTGYPRPWLAWPDAANYPATVLAWPGAGGISGARVGVARQGRALRGRGWHAPSRLYAAMLSEALVGVARRSRAFSGPGYPGPDLALRGAARLYVYRSGRALRGPGLSRHGDAGISGARDGLAPIDVARVDVARVEVAGLAWPDVCGLPGARVCVGQRGQALRDPGWRGQTDPVTAGSSVVWPVVIWLGTTLRELA